MKHTMKTIIFATMASGLLLSTAPASFAAGQNTQALVTSVATSMTKLGMEPANLGALTHDELLEIENIVQSGGKIEDKKAAIDTVLQSRPAANADAKLSKNVASSAGLRERVVAGARDNGVTIAQPGNLSLSQLEQIDIILGSSDKSRLKADEIKTVLGEASGANAENGSSAERYSIAEQVKSLGLSIAAPEALTDDQVDKLTTILNNSDKASDKKMAVKSVLQSI